VSTEHHSLVPGGRVLGPGAYPRTNIPVPDNGAGHQGRHYHGARPADGH